MLNYGKFILEGFFQLRAFLYEAISSIPAALGTAVLSRNRHRKCCPYPSWPLPSVELLKLTPWQWEAEEVIRSKALVFASDAFNLYLRSLADYSHDHSTVRVGDLRYLLQLSPQTLYGLIPHLNPLPGAPTRIHLSTLLRLAKVESA